MAGERDAGCTKKAEVLEILFELHVTNWKDFIHIFS
jgi:hypothetical protein